MMCKSKCCLVVSVFSLMFLSGCEKPLTCNDALGQKLIKDSINENLKNNPLDKFRLLLNLDKIGIDVDAKKSMHFISRIENIEQEGVNEQTGELSCLANITYFGITDKYKEDILYTLVEDGEKLTVEYTLIPPFNFE